jgi:hypothetical protein
MGGVTWRRSTRSRGNGGDCVEVAELDDTVGLRDSKEPTGPVLRIDRVAWQAFVAGLRRKRLKPL